MAIREHVLFGSRRYGTERTGCGKKPELHINKTVDGKRVGPDYYTLGAGSVQPEADFMKLFASHPQWCCRTCVKAMRKVYRDRFDKFPDPGLNARKAGQP